MFLHQPIVSSATSLAESWQSALDRTIGGNGKVTISNREANYFYQKVLKHANRIKPRVLNELQRAEELLEKVPKEYEEKIGAVVAQRKTKLNKREAERIKSKGNLAEKKRKECTNETEREESPEDLKSVLSPPVSCQIILRVEIQLKKLVISESEKHSNSFGWPDSDEQHHICSTSF